MLSLCLVSADRALFELCRNTIEQLGVERCELQWASNGLGHEECQIYIWDTETIPKVPAAMVAADRATKLIIVRKALLPSIRAKLPHGRFEFLHCPITKLSLRVALESAMARWEVSESGRSDSTAPDPARDKILQKLLETNLKLQQYDTERTSFLTRAVHDIRAPLMAIQGYCGLLLAGQFGQVSDEQAQILERMQRSLSRLDGLAAALMDLGMGGKATARLKLKHGSLEECVSQAVHEVRPFAMQKQIDLSVDIRPQGAPLLLDGGKIEQVLVNLLENGCKFTPKGGAIRIRGYSVYSEGTSGEIPFPGYRLDITDTGPGIDEQRIQHVFDEYTTYGGPSDRAGAGLGLAICRMIVGAHGGRIWAQSQGSGTTFSILLPYTRTYVERPQGLEAMRAAV